MGKMKCIENFVGKVPWKAAAKSEKEVGTDDSFLEYSTTLF
jgi:hypothetical protein